MTETKWTCKLDRIFREHCGGLVVPQIAGKYGFAGVADRYWCCAAWAGFIEFKSETRGLTTLQVKFLQDVWKRRPRTAYVLKRCGDDARVFRADLLSTAGSKKGFLIPGLGVKCEVNAVLSLINHL